MSLAHNIYLTFLNNVFETNIPFNIRNFYVVAFALFFEVIVLESSLVSNVSKERYCLTSKFFK